VDPRTVSRVRVLLLAGTALTATVAISAFRAQQSPSAAPPPLSVEVGPTRVPAAGWSPITFTFRARPGGLHRGRLKLSLPAGWARPSRSAAYAGRATTSAGVLAVHGDSITVRGIDLSRGESLTVTYGGGARGATEPAAVGKYTFAVSAAGDSSAPLAPVAHSPSVRVTAPAFSCRSTKNPSGVGLQLLLPNGVAQANLHNTGSSAGVVEQCYTSSGLSTKLQLSGISPTGFGPAGYPELAYGYHLYGQPFCRNCHVEPFPLRVSDLRRPANDYRVTAKYSLARPSPRSLPYDFIYDLWLERNPTPGRGPRRGDLELIVFLYRQTSATCRRSRAAVAFSTKITFNRRSLVSRWRVCEIDGGTEATPVAFSLEHPSQAQSGEISLRLGDFADEAGRFLGRDVGSHSLMGFELGGEFDVCSPPAGCVTPNANWRWRVSRLELEGPSAAIPVAFSVRR
jgi:hypothetical protein